VSAVVVSEEDEASIVACRHGQEVMEELGRGACVRELSTVVRLLAAVVTSEQKVRRRMRPTSSSPVATAKLAARSRGHITVVEFAADCAHAALCGGAQPGSHLAAAPCRAGACRGPRQTGERGQGPCAAAPWCSPSGFSTAGSKFISIVRRAQMVNIGDKGIYTGSGLRGVIPYLQCGAAVFPS
jgi:hypothetical protein